MYQLRCTWVTLVLLAFFAAESHAAHHSKPKPNIIVIVSDDQGWGDVGFNGSTDINTPHLDQLASDGIVFDAGYVSHPYCSPSRAGFLTGRYQQRFGHENNTPYLHNDPEAGIPLTETTFAKVLQNNGYKTGMVGKWHVGDAPKFWPGQRGFDYWFGFIAGNMSFWGDYEENAYIPLGVLENGKRVSRDRISYLTDDFSREAVNFIDRNADQPFFMYASYNAPHKPLQAPRKYLEKTDYIEDGQRSVYAAMVVGMDEGIGALMSALKRKGIYENTLVIFFSDNGGHTVGANSQPYRGHKGMLFEGGIRVPFVVSWPKQLKGDRRFEHPISSLDVFPTVLAAAGIDHKPKKALDGINLLPYLKSNNKTKPHNMLYWRYSDGAGFAIRKNNYKMIFSGYKGKYHLFDLKSDPYEQINLADKNKSKLAELEKDYKAWDKQLVKARWYDPHGKNVKKEEAARLKYIDAAYQGEKP